MEELVQGEDIFERLSLYSSLSLSIHLPLFLSLSLSLSLFFSLYSPLSLSLSLSLSLYSRPIQKEISTRNGFTPQQKLCTDIAELMSALPNGKNRTREQVKERIKHEVRKIGKWIAAEVSIKI